MIQNIATITEASLRDAEGAGPLCPCTPLRSMHGYDAARPSGLFIKLFFLTRVHEYQSRRQVCNGHLTITFRNIKLNCKISILVETINMLHRGGFGTTFSIMFTM